MLGIRSGFLLGFRRPIFRGYVNAVSFFRECWAPVVGCPNSWAKQNKTPRSALPKLHPKRELHLQNLFFHKLGGDPTAKWMNLLEIYLSSLVFFQVGYKHQTHPGICSHFSMMWCVDSRHVNPHLMGFCFNDMVRNATHWVCWNV